MCSVCAVWAQPVGLCKNSDCFEKWHQALKQEWAKSECITASIEEEAIDDNNLTTSNVECGVISDHSSDDDILVDMITPNANHCNQHMPLRILSSDDEDESKDIVLSENVEEESDDDIY